jgi:hypothetical protein
MNVPSLVPVAGFELVVLKTAIPTWGSSVCTVPERNVVLVVVLQAFPAASMTTDPTAAVVKGTGTALLLLQRLGRREIRQETDDYGPTVYSRKMEEFRFLVLLLTSSVHPPGIVSQYHC